MDFLEKYLRSLTLDLEMIWQNSRSLGSATDIFTGVFPGLYLPPHGFCFDCGDSPIMVGYGKCIVNLCYLIG